MNEVVISILLMFLKRQLAKWGQETNWELVKKDFSERIRKLVPGEEYDNTAEAAIRIVIDLVAEGLGSNKLLDTAFQEALLKVGI